MRACLAVLVAGLAFSLTPSSAHAQFGYSSYGYWVTPTPYYVPGPVSYYSTYGSPTGYRSAYATGVYPTPWGSNTYSAYRTQIRPVYSSPVHSIYFDPFANMYRFGPGYRNTPSYSYRYYYGW